MSRSHVEISGLRHRPGAATWTRQWESDSTTDEHQEVAELLVSAFPHTPAFAEGGSWAGARPEVRVLGHVDGALLAHAAVTRRFIRTDECDVLVGDVGLVAVHPERHGLHLGAALMAEVARTLADLPVPYGFLTCGPDVEAFYRRCGWSKTYQPLTSINIHQQIETERRNGMVLPVNEPLTTWPRGHLARDGQEI